MDNSTANTENQNQLAPALRKLKPAGDGGFEELIKVLLENLTGRKFYLARSGNQEGRDISSDHQQGSVIAVECKRYGKATELNERELLGELVQASTAIPDLDLWVLVTSRNITSQLNESLSKAAHYHGVEFYVINTGMDGDVGDLDRLCARFPHILKTHLQQAQIDVNLAEVLQWLERVRSDASFDENINRLVYDLQAQNIGYENWRIDTNQRFLSSLKSVNESKANYGQKLDVLAANTQFVARTKTEAKLRAWLHDWPQHKSALVVLGEEGDGKTWGGCQVVIRANKK